MLCGLRLLLSVPCEGFGKFESYFLRHRDQHQHYSLLRAVTLVQLVLLVVPLHIRPHLLHLELFSCLHATG